MQDTFHRDLAGGQLIEEEILEILKHNHPDAVRIEGYCKEWDIFIPNEKYGVEVKSDKMSQKTGNIVVEVMFNGKDSAMRTSKAKIWVFHTGTEIIWVYLDKLKELVKKYKTVHFTARGDSKEKEAYLIPITDIRDIGFKI
jgi:hypothetical protein